MNDFSPDLKMTCDELLLGLPGVSVGKAFGYPAYIASGQVFAFVASASIALKLPEKRIRQLIAKKKSAIKPFEPVAGMIWSEWVAIDRDNAWDYEQDMALFKESARFVSK